jgi:hypothetical protein
MRSLATSAQHIAKAGPRTTLNSSNVVRLKRWQVPLVILAAWAARLL